MDNNLFAFIFSSEDNKTVFIHGCSNSCTRRIDFSDYRRQGIAVGESNRHISPSTNS